MRARGQEHHGWRMKNNSYPLFLLHKTAGTRNARARRGRGTGLRGACSPAEACSMDAGGEAPEGVACCFPVCTAAGDPVSWGVACWMPASPSPGAGDPVPGGCVCTGPVSPSPAGDDPLAEREVAGRFSPVPWDAGVSCVAAAARSCRTSSARAFPSRAAGSPGWMTRARSNAAIAAPVSPMARYTSPRLTRGSVSAGFILAARAKEASAWSCMPSRASTRPFSIHAAKEAGSAPTTRV